MNVNSTRLLPASAVQLVLMTQFYGYESALQGYSMLRRVFNDSDWALSAHFPRVTHCDILVRQFGSDLPLTVQCMNYVLYCTHTEQYSIL